MRGIQQLPAGLAAGILLLSATSARASTAPAGPTNANPPVTATPHATASATATPSPSSVPTKSAAPSVIPAAASTQVRGASSAPVPAASPATPATAATPATPTPAPTPIPNLRPVADSSGTFSTFSSTGTIDTSGPFFQSLGTNGRSCSTCHAFTDGWTISSSHVQERFNASQGLDPLFRTVDGSNSPNADVSTVEARRAAYSMLLKKAVIRVGMPIPSGADFRLVGVDDPYHFASSKELSLFRRPLPATNLGFLSTIMWDGREPSLANQSNDATLGHAQAASPLTDQEKAQIVAFESALFTAQTVDREAGNLTSTGGDGGPVSLSKQNFFVGINDPLGNNPTGAGFTPNAFTVYQAWLDSPDPNKQSVARGEELFNTKTFTIRGVGGLNDVLGKETITGTCTTCHDTFNVGDHSVKAPLNIGVADPSGHPGLDTSGMPVYTLQCDGSPNTVETTDPGRALISGKCADIGKFKGPILRGLAARAPYFHNGSGTSLADVVTFYDHRFNIGFSSDEEADLVHFLQTL